MLFEEILIILVLSIVILLLGHRLHIPPVVSFIFTGALAGPRGLALIGQRNDVEALAELGIVLLLFGVGMEFSVKKMQGMKKYFLCGGVLQVGLTVAITAGISWLGGVSWLHALFLGILLAMSSTAVVIGLLDQNREAMTLHGRISIAILIFQDLIAIPFLLLVPLLGGGGEGDKSLGHLVGDLAKGVLILFLVFFSAQRIVPRLLHLVARTRNRELFLFSVLTLCFGVAWFTSYLGLSLSIGAFLAGVTVSETDYSHEATGHLFPFQAVFISFFFVSIGMLLDVNFVLMHVPLIGLLAVSALLIKGFTGLVTALLLGIPVQNALMMAIALSQIGEFSFVLAKAGVEQGWGSSYDYQLFLSTSLLTLIVSPFAIQYANRLITYLAKRGFLTKYSLPATDSISTEAHSALTHHVIIAGFGVAGRHLAHSCKTAGIPYVVLEMNLDTIKVYKEQGEPILFGDATHAAVLEHLGIREAQALAVLINDAPAARQTVSLARQMNDAIYIVVRTPYVRDVALMHRLGADEVIPDEVGTSIEVFSRVLRRYHISDQKIHSLVSEMRGEGYVHY